MIVFIFAGALFGFSLARLQYLSINDTFCNASKRSNSASPGECYWYTIIPRYRIGVIIHLATILPAGLLVVFQFVPAIRHKFILYHRIAGYVILLLALMSIISAIVIVDQSFGGHIETQGALGLLGIASVIGLSLAYYNIKRKQIDQHRAWMLRSWFWMSSIITLRLIMIISAMILSSASYYRLVYEPMPCPKVFFILVQANTTFATAIDPAAELGRIYSTCAGQATNVSAVALVRANMSGGAPGAGAALNAVFGMAAWLALALHAIGVEIYLHLTPREAERLRKVSYQRQLEAGFKHPGSAGLVVQRLGDADEWVMKDEGDNMTKHHEEPYIKT